MARILAAIILFSLSFSNLHADEGMWIPMLLKSLNEGDMQSKGLKLTAEDLYSINNSSLKDAIVHFGRGCTAEMISGEGLLLTNHHCGYGQIQQHSSVENDYLTDGFWAMTRKDELANPGLSATFIVRMEDVTKKVMDGITDDTPNAERPALVAANIKEITAEAIKDTHYEAFIRPFFYGNEYYMFITETYKDVRLVGAPPSSIGKFGGDTDNWMWPRHTGDFSVFRIYADKDNKPAEYSEDNVPYKPRHFLPISLKGVNEGDFTMVYGFPGRTSEYLTSYAVDYVMNVSNPARIDYRKVGLDALDANMKSSDAIRIKYASRYASTANYYKKWIGENRGLKKLDAINTKKDFEKRYQDLADSKPHWKKRYGNLLPQFESLYKELEPYNFSRDMFIEMVYYGPELVWFGNNFTNLIEKTSNGELIGDNFEKEVERLKKVATSHFKDYDLATEKKLFKVLMEKYEMTVDDANEPDVFAVIRGKYKGDYAKYAEYIYGKSQLATKEKTMALLDGMTPGKAKKLSKDPIYLITRSFYDHYYLNVKDDYGRISNEIDQLSRLYVEGMRKMEKKVLYPDANSTLRVAYGKVEGYEPANGVKYRHYTTLSGIIEKKDPDNDEFVVPAKLEELYNNKDFGQYGQDGEMWVCFTASNHTTGGNSGSPVIDASGNLIGLNFDRGWEGTMSDIMFDPDRCRNISVDARYVLFVIDKFAGAGHLVKEMKLVK